ncbi:MAG: YdcF family protein [Maricaulaceae bacterium]|jgi:uncharacterized SAM-binding protein YcdF (DUF218 family)
MLQALRNLLLLLAFVFVAGFAVFVEATTRAAPPPPPAGVDGVVALTGGGGARIAAAMALLEEGTGARMFVSGVNPSTTDDDIRRLAGGTDAMFDCCVDIGRAARTTVGNAYEVAAWARENDYDSLIVVTSDFHMPRALIELGRTMDGISLHPFPVSRAAQTAKPWWRDFGTARRVAVEYVKYLVILGHEAVGQRGSGNAATNDDAGADPS